MRSSIYVIILSMHPLYEKANKVSAEVYEAALEVQKHFGIGLPESLYQKCLFGDSRLGHSGIARVILKGANTPDL